MKPKAKYRHWRGRWIAILVCLSTILLTAAPAKAVDVCPDLWFSRNAIFNDAGFCFNSTLGKALFDNSDCHTRSPVLPQSLQAKITRIKQYEKNFGCRVNTKRSTLAVDKLAIRLQLWDHPVADGFQSTCIGVILNGQVTLYAAKDPASQVIGFFEDGDTIDFSHEPEGDWDFASGVSRDGEQFEVLGWYRAPVTPETCRDYAG
ncbi:MAG: DUF4453 domain-containing protein [Alphaproteobacteria bacterium]|nr:DUF4453 domain-containing protein [Alphaproteobacteria bacterium]